MAGVHSILPSKYRQAAHLLVGKAVGILFACAIGLMALLGPLWLIPFTLLFTNSEDRNRT